MTQWRSCIGNVFIPGSLEFSNPSTEKLFRIVSIFGFFSFLLVFFFFSCTWNTVFYIFMYFNVPNTVEILYNNHALSRREVAIKIQ